MPKNTRSGKMPIQTTQDTLTKFNLRNTSVHLSKLKTTLFFKLRIITIVFSLLISLLLLIKYSFFHHTAIIDAAMSSQRIRQILLDLVPVGSSQNNVLFQLCSHNIENSGTKLGPTLIQAVIRDDGFAIRLVKRGYLLRFHFDDDKLIAIEVESFGTGP